MPRRREPLRDANDYLAGGNVFGSGGQPRHYFPGVNYIGVKGRLRDPGPYAIDPEVSTFWKPDYPQAYRHYLTPCGNSTCMGGGYLIHDTVTEMIAKKETDRVVETMICKGTEKGLNRQCLHFCGPVTFKIEYAASPPLQV